MPDPSLIARRNISSAPRMVSRGLGILLVLAIIFVSAVLAVYGGAVGYRKTLESSLESATQELAKLQDKFQPDNIRKIAEADRALYVARSLLASHVYTTNVFSFLQNTTLRNVRYKNVAYTANPRQLTLATEVEGYAGLKRQIELLEQSPFIRSAIFSSLTRSDAGTVGFSLQVTFESTLLRFGAVQNAPESAPAPALPSPPNPAQP